MRPRLPWSLLLATVALVGASSPTARAQSSGTALGAPRASDGAEVVDSEQPRAPVPPPVPRAPATPTPPSEPSPSGTPSSPAPSPASPAAPPPGAVPPPPSGSAEPPSSYQEPAGYPPPASPASQGRYPTGSRGPYGEGADVPGRIATRLRVLDANFQTLASRGGNGVVDGILSIVTGGLAITLGIVVDDELLSPYLYVYGGAGVARGVIDIALTPNPTTPAIAFAHMPMGTPAEVQARLDYGETELESLANRTRLARVLEASINIGAGVAIVPVYLGPNDFEIDEFGAFVLIGASISVVSGLINLFTRSEAERRWSAYTELRARLAATPQAKRPPSVRLSYGFAPIRNGGMGTLSLKF